jgi:hypothetical protein
MCFAAIVILYLGFLDKRKAVVRPATPALHQSTSDTFAQKLHLSRIMGVPNDHNFLLHRE